MSQGFKLRFDQLRENEVTGQETAAGIETLESYASPGYTRNVCLLWPDGRRYFLNYAYLIAGEFEPNSDKNLIKLSFSTHLVSLEGYSLEPLFMALLDHLPRIISAIDPRYVLADDQLTPVVEEIRVDKRED